MSHVIPRTNFFAWMSHVVHTTIGHELNKLLFSDISTPLKLLSGQRIRKDQLFLSSLRSFMIEGMLATMATYSTSLTLIPQHPTILIYSN